MFVRGVLCCAIFVFRNDRFGRGVSLIKIAKKKYMYILNETFLLFVGFYAVNLNVI